MQAAAKLDDFDELGFPECRQNPVDVEVLGVGFRRGAGGSQHLAPYLVFDAPPFPLQRACSRNVA